MKKGKLIGLLGILTAGVLALSACGSSSKQAGKNDFRTLDEIKKSGTINIGVFSDKHPFGYVDENGEYQGYDIYFGNRLAEDLGVKINYVSTEAANRVEYLETGKVDIILANFTVTPERAEAVDFALPYMNVGLGVISSEKDAVASLDNWNADDEMVLNKLRNAKAPVVLAINKVDNIKNKDELLPFITDISSKFNFAHIVPISAQHGNNVHELEKIVRQSLREGAHHFPEDYVTDRSQRFMASEIIREKLMRFMGEELPYSVTVEIEQFKVNERGTYEINALILVERDGQKKIVIGHKGEKLKKIGTEARLDMERLFDNKVHLELWVKVKSGWADDERALRSLGYMED